MNLLANALPNLVVPGLSLRLCLSNGSACLRPGPDLVNDFDFSAMTISLWLN